MLQKIVNGIAIASGVVSLTVIGLGGYVFIRKDAIIDNVKGKVMEAVSDKLGDLGSLGSLGGGALGGEGGVIPDMRDMTNPMAAPSEPTAPESPVPFGF